MKKDDETTVSALRDEVTRFRDARNWKQFHQPKDLAVGLSIEAAELLEPFLWKTTEEVEAFLRTAEGAAKLREEVADCFIFLLHFAERCDLDLSSALIEKLRQNERKYPVEKSYNSAKKYTEL